MGEKGGGGGIPCGCVKEVRIHSNSRIREYRWWGDRWCWWGKKEGCGGEVCVSVEEKKGKGHLFQRVGMEWFKKGTAMNPRVLPTELGEGKGRLLGCGPGWCEKWWLKRLGKRSDGIVVPEHRGRCGCVGCVWVCGRGRLRG